MTRYNKLITDFVRNLHKNKSFLLKDNNRVWDACYNQTISQIFPHEKTDFDYHFFKSDLVSSQEGFLRYKSSRRDLYHKL